MPFLYRCTSFQESFEKEDHSVGLQVNQKLNQLAARKEFVPSKTLKVYDRSGIYIQRIMGHGTNMRVIIQEHKFPCEGEEHTFYFLREYIPQNKYEPRWRSKVLPYIENGVYKDQFPLSAQDRQAGETAYQAYLDQRKHSLPEPPGELTEWFRDEKFGLDPKFSIYETQLWMAFSDGEMKDFANDFYRALQAVYNEDTSTIVYEPVEEVKEHRRLQVAHYEDIYLIYEALKAPGEEEQILLLHNGGFEQHSEEYQNRKQQKIAAAVRYPPLRGVQNYEYSVEQFTKGAVRAYPAGIVNRHKGRDEWRAIQTHSNKSNLALSAEQLELLKEFDFPKFINGQAGSGKSEMLYYLYAEMYFRQQVYGFEAPILFLTENEELLNQALQDTRNKLMSNSEYQGVNVDPEKVKASFYSFRHFLLQELVEEPEDYPEEKYLNFARFKTRYENSTIHRSVKQKYPAEVAWYVIHSFIKGQEAGEEAFSLEKFREMPKKDRSTIDEGTYKDVYEKIWSPFYRKLRAKGYWDRLDLVRDILSMYDDIPREQKYMAILCDEAQDFTRVELQLLIRLSLFTDYNLEKMDRVPITFAGDPFQTVNPTGFSLVKLKRLFENELTKELKFKLKTDLDAELTFNYRSSPAVVAFANAVQLFRRDFLETTDLEKPQEAKRLGGGSTPAYYCLDYNPRKLREKLSGGQVFILGCNDGEEGQILQQDEWLQDKDIIKSAARSKGSEYPGIVLYKFGEQFVEEFSENQLRQLLERRESYEKLTAGERFQLSFFFNKLYVAITRAQESCIVVDTDRGIDCFWKILQELDCSEAKVESWERAFEKPFLEAGKLDMLAETDVNNLLRIAEEDRKNGLAYEDAYKMRDAAKAYQQLGKDFKADVDYCQAKALQFEQQYEAAGDQFREMKKHDDASECYWIGQKWQRLIELHADSEEKKMRIRRYVAQLMSGDDHYEPALELGGTLMSAVDEPDLRGKISWRKAWVERLSELTLHWSKNLTEAQAAGLAGSLGAIKIKDDVFFNALAYLHQAAGQAQKAIQYWELTEDYEHEDYYKAKLSASTEPLERVYYLQRLNKPVELVAEYLKAREAFTEESELSLVLDALVKTSKPEEAIRLVGDYPELRPQMRRLIVGKDASITRLAMLLSRLVDAMDRNPKAYAGLVNAKLAEQAAQKIIEALPDDELLNRKKPKFRKRRFADKAVGEAANAYTRLLARSSLRPDQQTLSNSGKLIHAYAESAAFEPVNLMAEEWACAIERTHSKLIDALKLFDGHRNFLLRRKKLPQPVRQFLLHRWLKMQYKRNLFDLKLPLNTKVHQLAPEKEALLRKLLRDSLEELQEKKVKGIRELRQQLPELDNILDYPDFYSVWKAGAPPAEEPEVSAPLPETKTEPPATEPAYPGVDTPLPEPTPAEPLVEGNSSNGESDHPDEAVIEPPASVADPLPEPEPPAVEPVPATEGLSSRLNRLEGMLEQIIEQQRGLQQQVRSLQSSRNEDAGSLKAENEELWRMLAELQQRLLDGDHQ